MLQLVRWYSTTTSALVAVAVSFLMPIATVATHIQSVPPLLTLANDGVSVGFSTATGELVSLVNRVGAGSPDDYLPPPPPPSPPSPPPVPSCVGNDAETAFYIKTGGDANVSS